MKRTVLIIILLLIGLMPLGSCSWLKKRQETKKERAAEMAAAEAAPGTTTLADEAPAPVSRWRRWLRLGPKGEKQVPWVEISFPDPALNRAIRNAIHRPQKGKLYKEDVQDLTVLKIPGWNVRDLSGMENCRNLLKLDLSWNPQIHDLTPLRELTRLQELYLRNLSVSNLEPLAGLVNLTILDLANNQISDLEPLAALTGITDLDLSFNRIANLEPLRNLKHLSQLGLYQNKVSQLSPLAALTNLTDLDLTSNEVLDLDPLVINSQNGGLGNGDVIYVFGNPLGKTTQNQIAQLEKNGAQVLTEYAKYKDR